jgi:hypothetical protein
MRSKKLAILSAVFGSLVLAVAAQAAGVNGIVTNRTTGKPSVGDAVVLVEPMTGMREVERTTTDARGHYSLNLPGSNPYLVKVIHQGAEYFISAPEGGGQGDISVYDVAAKIDGVTIQEHLIAPEVSAGQLHVVERYLLHNASNPPRTQWSKQSFELVLPDGAMLGDASAQRPGASSLPTSIKLDPAGAKDHYSFNFPIQPDEGGKGTMFQLEYTLPYSGSYTFHSQVTIPAHTVWVVLPKAMSLKAQSGTNFQSSPQDPSVQTFVTTDAGPGKSADFTISGTGAFPREEQGAQGAPAQAGAAMPQPGGGIGEPINTPDPLSKYKWWVLGGLALLLVAAAAFLLRKPAGAPAAAGVASPGALAATAMPAFAATPAGKSTALLNALKEELFALESEKLNGTISAAEYAEQKAALETVLKRALKRG